MSYTHALKLHGFSGVLKPWDVVLNLNKYLLSWEYLLPIGLFKQLNWLYLDAT